jgi:HAD superfamily hydrolase (TIGR01509 family)
MTRPLWGAVDDYIAGHLLSEDPVLDAALAASEEAGLPPGAISPHQGTLLELLVRMTGARRVLEIGTLGGYSTIWLARALPPDGPLARSSTRTARTRDSASRACGVSMSYSPRTHEWKRPRFRPSTGRVTTGSRWRSSRPSSSEAEVGDWKLVIFDCDGVLVDSEPISCSVLARLLTAEGLPTTLAQARRDYQGLLLTEVRASAEAKLGRALADDWLTGFERERAEEFARQLEAVSGALDAVERVTEAGLRVCVASQGKREKTELSLELTGLRGHFSDRALFSADEVLRGKPHPDLFLHAARMMGGEPEGCVVVEDTPPGVRAAISAGMRALGYAADSDEEALGRAGADTFHSMAELPRLLGLG